MMIRISLLMLATAVSLCARCAEYGFDLRGKSPRLANALAAQRTSDGLLRRTVLGAGATDAAALAVGDRLVFRLFDDVEVELTLKERTESPLGGESFLASAGGSEVLDSVVVQDASGITVNYTDTENDRVYTIVSTHEGVTVQEVDPRAGVCEPTPSRIPDLSGEPPSVRPLVQALADQASTLIDVLVAFDQDATSWAKQNGGGITNFATAAVQKMNTAIANSGLSSNFRFRLVGAMTVAAQGGTDLDGVLDAATDGTGDWASVKAMRETVGADVVTVLIDTGSAYGTTGLGWALSDSSRLASFANHAYNVCSIRAVSQSHTMTHEAGHNLGAGHSDMQASSPGPQLYSYSAGYYFTAGGKNYATVMSYTSDGYGGSYTRVPYFSSPSCKYEGVTVGDADHDNARTISQTYAAASQWRAQKVPMSYDVTFSPAGGSTFTSSITVTMTPGKANLPIRYTLDGTTPTKTSTLYTGPVTLTKSTTIRAVTVTDGVLGPVYEATYAKSDLGEGADAPQLVWRTSSDYPWTFQTTNTYDGVDALQSAWMPTGSSHDSWLETEVTGPTTMSFALKIGYLYSSTFSVTCDGTVKYSFSEQTTPTDWRLVEIDVPSGKHTIRFNFALWGYYRNVFNGVYIDQVRFDALSSPPTLSPATTADEATATTFNGSTTVTLTPPSGKTGTIYYTVDGTDPTGDGGQVYGRPLALTRSTLVRAVFVEAGKDPSVETTGLYLERHPVRPGEWTTDVAGVKTAAATDGRLMAVLLAHYDTCGWCKSFYPIATDKTFLAWAEANGIYLVTADETLHCDTETSEAWFWTLNGSGSVSYPTFQFAKPQAPTTSVGSGTARNSNGSYKIGTVVYDDTVAALAAGIASVLGETVPSAPTTSSPAFISSYPVSVTLSNPNGSGSIYYTLDGSTPSKSKGTKYTGAITITKATVLKAAVRPTSGCSSLPLVQTFMTAGEALGTDGLAWTTGGNASWIGEMSETHDGTSAMRSGAIGGNQTSWIETTVSGPGEISFWWYADCEGSTWDYLFFSIDDVQTNKIGGTSCSWTRCRYDLPAGSHTLRWTYRKDGSVDKGLDAGFLDQVVWTPAVLEEFPYVVQSGKAVITGYNGASRDVTVPLTLGGYAVSGIAANAFSSCGSLERLVLPGRLDTTNAANKWGLGISSERIWVKRADYAYWSSVLGTSIRVLDPAVGSVTVTDLYSAYGGFYYRVNLSPKDKSFLVDAASLAAAGIDVSGGVTASLLNATGRNGIPRFESYLLGLDADSDTPAGEQIQPEIAFDDNGLPVITCTPKINSDFVTYTTLGKASLADVGWKEVTDANRAAMKFFKIRVDVK